MQDNHGDKQLYRANIAEWYNISERALRDRMQKKAIHITNRVLTDDDIRAILQTLGKPQCFPPELYDRFFGETVFSAVQCQCLPFKAVYFSFMKEKEYIPLYQVIVATDT
ncbi:MAG: hypothetical protein U5L45_12555 [Saprospiraceae bacterium]|nr:hypothetical protein [Saprospiraceae bacterium]